MKTLCHFAGIRSGAARSRKTSFFTLLELLIVIAIITVLTGMLMPALNSARGKALTISCTSNQKTWGLCLLMYTDDNGGCFPLYEKYPAPAGYDRCYWFAARKSGTSDWEVSAGPLAPYLTNARDLSACPGWSDYDKSGYDAGCGGYGFVNGDSLSGVGSTPMQTSRFRKVAPAVAAMLGDTASPKNWSPTDTAVVQQAAMYTPYTASWCWPNTPSTHFRHFLTANITFADGHAEPMQAYAFGTMTSSSPVKIEDCNAFGDEYKALHLGFLEPKHYFIFGLNE